MSERTRSGLGVLGAGLLLGVLGDLLLRETPWGLNWTLWSVSVAVTAVALVKLVGFERPPPWPWLMGLAVLFSAGLSWRASPALAALNLACSFAAVALATGVLRSGVLTYAAAAGRLVAQVTLGPVPAATEADWNELSREGWSHRAAAVARGVAIAVPLLLVFGALFVAADAVFEDLVRGAFDVESVFLHMVVIALWTWIGCGLLQHALLRREPIAVRTERRLGATEVAVVLGTLNALFLAFVVVQLRYLFGGDDHVLETTGLTYAEYARRGFFELVTVVALAVPVLLAGDALARPRRLFRLLSFALLALLAVVIASAVERMRLYTDAYGLTQLRVYVLAFMCWLALVLAWMLATILRDRHALFMPGAFAAALVSVAALNVVNPDGLIARVNIDRHLDSAKRLDSFYLRDLSEDAAPAIVARLPRLERDHRLLLETDLRERVDNDDWRAWSWGRARAHDALDDYARSVAAASR